MKRFLLRASAIVALVGAVNSASAFSLIGPFDTWQVPGIGYDPVTGVDLGGPMNLSEGYRWNVKTIYYGFDPSFMHYFGLKGSNAVVQALEVYNSLPAMSKLSADLHEFPTESRSVNYRATSLQILDLKSHVMAVMTEFLGLTAAERFVWTLRDRRPIAGTPDFQYLVIQRNFDPVTAAPSLYVNGTLYYYVIQDPIPLAPPPGNYADAIELPVDPLQSFTSVSSASANIYGLGLFQGAFLTGLTRDDVGGLRYLYNKGVGNQYVESLVTNAFGTGSGSPFSPGSGSNALVIAALRTGVDKIQFKLAKNDSLFGPFIVFTNSNKDTFVTNSHKITQTFQRAMTQPDIIFAAADNGLDGGGNPRLAVVNSFPMVNNAAMNTFVPGGPTAGPGNIQPPIIISFSKIGPFLINQGPNFLDQANSFVGLVWGSYDGSTNDPIVYPQPPGQIGMTIQDLEQVIFAP